MPNPRCSMVDEAPTHAELEPPARQVVDHRHAFGEAAGGSPVA